MPTARRPKSKTSASSLLRRAAAATDDLNAGLARVGARRIEELEKSLDEPLARMKKLLPTRH